MYVKVAVLKETHPNERRVVLVPSVAAELLKLDPKAQMQTGPGLGSNLADETFKAVVFLDDRKETLKDADVVLAIHAPELDVLNQGDVPSLVLIDVSCK